MKKIGIYSGTFDPVHEGHLAFARAAVEKCGLDKVFFLVEPRPRRKQGVKALEHRAEMVRLAVEHEPGFGSILLEQQRFTVTDTLPVLQQRFTGAELYMLMGDDMLAHFAEWPHVEELISGIRFVIGVRNHTAAEVKRRIGIVQKTRGLVMDYQLFQAPAAEYSSSVIRRQVKSGKQPDGLPGQVFEYIRAQGLYQSSESSSSSSK